LGELVALLVRGICSIEDAVWAHRRSDERYQSVPGTRGGLVAAHSEGKPSPLCVSFARIIL
jgi:hypothetical protein